MADVVAIIMTDVSVMFEADVIVPCACNIMADVVAICIGRCYSQLDVEDVKPHLFLNLLQQVWWLMLLPGGRWNNHCRVTLSLWQMLLPWVLILFQFKFWGVKQNLIPNVRQMVLAYISIEGWIIDPYV